MTHSRRFTALAIGFTVAVLAFAVSLLVVTYQLVDRGNPRRRVVRVSEAVARFR